MTMPNVQPFKSQHQRKKWLMLSVVGVALLLIPRRSSRRDSASIDAPNFKSLSDLNNQHIDNNDASL